jgi:hypothetical protein
VWFFHPKQIDNWDFPFYYDGETVTIWWAYGDSGLTRASPDDHYRLKARWDGDDLYYLNPLRKWEKLATFKNGRFQKEGNGRLWTFEAIRLTNVWDWARSADRLQKQLLVKRALWDYSIDFFDW